MSNNWNRWRSKNKTRYNNLGNNEITPTHISDKGNREIIKQKTKTQCICRVKTCNLEEEFRKLSERINIAEIHAGEIGRKIKQLREIHLKLISQNQKLARIARDVIHTILSNNPRRSDVNELTNLMKEVKINSPYGFGKCLDIVD